MPVRRLWLTDFRNHQTVDLTFGEGLTAIVGNNGQGKTNILEGLAWLSLAGSFRGASTETLVRNGESQAIVRAEVISGTRTVLLEAELSLTGRNKILVNSNPVKRARDLLGYLRTTVFAPDDLRLIKGSPGERREYLDHLLISLHPRNYELRTALDKVLRQRNTLLKQAKGRNTPDVLSTLDVWDAKLVETGEALVDARRLLVEQLQDPVFKILVGLQGEGATGTLQYQSVWADQGLAAALEESRSDDLRRGVTTVGPHRDDLVITLSGMPARIQASQGEQRSLALALRLGGHQVVADAVGVHPIILLDDVFSELDETRSTGLVALLPQCQTLVTSAGQLPKGVTTSQVIHLVEGKIQS